MPTLIIDADACPVTREALACARSARIPVLIAGNSTQNLARRIRRDDPRDANTPVGATPRTPGSGRIRLTSRADPTAPTSRSSSACSRTTWW